jgi:hypothetical protein
MNLKRMIAGKVAKRLGDQFETLLQNVAVSEGLESVRIPDGCKQLGKNKIKRVKTPFDFVFVKSQTEVIFADAKTSNGQTFAFSELTPHQVEALVNLSKKGVFAGYIVYFRGIDKIVWFEALKLSALNPRESLKPTDGVLLGSRFNFNFRGIFHPF